MPQNLQKTTEEEEKQKNLTQHELKKTLEEEGEALGRFKPKVTWVRCGPGQQDVSILLEYVVQFPNLSDEVKHLLTG